MSNVVGLSNSRRFDGRVLHVIAHLSFSVGRYIVDTAIAQARVAPGSVGVVTSVDVEGGGATSPTLIAELSAHHIPVFQCGDLFTRDAAGLRAAASQLREIIAGSDPNLTVHAHTAMAVAVSRWAGATRVLATFHGWNQNRSAHMELQDAMAFSMADRVSTVSDFWSGVLQTRTSLPAVAVLPYGLNLDRYPARRHARRDNRAPRVVVVGEITDRMGPDLVLNAMARLWAGLPAAEVHFIGDGSAREKTEALARSLDPSGTRVIFHGALSNVYDRLNEFDVFARANRSDDQSLPVAEAMLAGLPIVCTPIGSQAPWVRAARSGLVVPKDAPRRFAAALRVLLTTSVEGREELGAGARAFARSAFSIQRHVAQLDRLYVGEVPLNLPSSKLPKDQPLRLHLGCGSEHRNGWVNIDARSAANPDVVAVADSLPMFDDESVETIEACHLLEHLPVHEAKRAFEEWFRVLKAGGSLYLELPNLDACIRSLGKQTDPSGVDLGMIGLFGWPSDVARDGMAQVHKWGWTPESLAAALEESGFVAVEREPVTQTWRPATRLDRDFRVRAVKPVQHT